MTTTTAIDPAVSEWARTVRHLQQEAQRIGLSDDEVVIPLIPGATPAWGKLVQFLVGSNGELECEFVGEDLDTHERLKQIVSVVVYPDADPGSRAAGTLTRGPVLRGPDEVADQAGPSDAELLAAFAEFQRSGNLAKRTIKTRASILRSFTARQGTRLIDATAFHLRRDVARDGITGSTRASTRTVFRVFYSFLHGEGLRDDNPALRLPVVKVPPRKARPYTQQQIDLLLSTGAYKRTRAMILLAAYQGLRTSEIAAIHADDVDLEAGTLKVLGKGGRTDYLPLHETVRALANTMPADGWWFPARGGREGHIRGQSVSDLLHDARERAGIVDERLTGHSLRHSFGTELVRGGANISAVQELMRHSSLQTTQGYVAVIDDDRRDALNVLVPRTVQQHSGRGTRTRGET